MQKKHKTHSVKGLIAALLAAVLLCGVAMPLAVYATTQSELQGNVTEAKSEYNAASSALKDAQKETAGAKAQVNNLNQQSKIIVEQINLVDAEIDNLTVLILEKEDEIAAKQAEIDARWDDFKSRMAAMQELNDSGAMTMLSAVKNLYQFLTFNEALQDISVRDNEVLDEMQRLKTELETAKAECEAAKTAMEEQKAQLEAKKAELAASLKNANKTLSDAKAAEAAQQIITDEARKKWVKAQEELDAYIRSQLEQAGSGGMSCGMNFLPTMEWYRRISTYFADVDSLHLTGHGGVDYTAREWTKIYAAESGTVTIARKSSSYGNYVTINHGVGTDGNRYATVYAHMVQYIVSEGQHVERGQIIGYVGSTGRSTGYHLHLELRRNGVRMDPRALIPDPEHRPWESY